MNEVLTIILGGGQGSRLYPLTKMRAKPAVPLGGKYRLIDITLSNCVHSGMHRVFVLTQFLSVSLNRHINRAFAFDRLRRGFVDVIPATQSKAGENDWFQGTADAVRKSMVHFQEHLFTDYLILSGDHLYRMDYRDIWNIHRSTDADVTIATTPVGVDRISEFGIMQVDDNDRVIGFAEKPTNTADVIDCRVSIDKGSNRGNCYLASMGIYIFKRQVLDKLLKERPENDFGYNIVPYAIENTRAYAYRFNGYWEDIGKIEDFYRANIRLTDVEPVFSFYDTSLPIFTRARIIPGSVLDQVELANSIVCEGSVVNRSKISRSVLGIRSIINSGCHLENTLMMGADFYETNQHHFELKSRNLPPIGVGENCHINGAIIDKNARIGSKVIITPKEASYNYDGDGFVVRNGITVIEKNAIIPAGMVI